MTEAIPARFANLANYLETGITDVDGWLSPTTATMLAHLLMQQVSSGLQGDVCEIGVHYGRLFLILANSTIEGERAVAVDVFGDQAKNVDQSGAGDRAIFEQHLARYAPDVSVDIIEASSLDLAAHDFLDRRFRFMSIDGGHTAAVTLNDLRLAERTLLPGGVAALDDILSYAWTGVLTGVADYVAAGGGLIPFALLPHKLLLTNSVSAAAGWRDWLKRGFPLSFLKSELEFPGGRVDSYLEHPFYTREAHAGLRRQIEVLNEANAKLSAELGRLKSSASWRVTGPLRTVISRLKT